MQNQKKLYNPNDDPQFTKPFIDSDEWKVREGIRCRIVHGGFKDTGVKFLFVLPEKENYDGRFYQYLSPFPGPDEELASLSHSGMEDRISFALTHGAYFIETNMGSSAAFGAKPDATMLYRSSAASAEYSRKLAAEMYGGGRPYGYVYGGSGGGFKTMSCIENTTTYDGAVPFVIGSPVALPHSITVRGHGKRLLRRVLPLIADALEPGGSGDVYAGLNEEEKDALQEVTRFGFALRAWMQYPFMDDGALPVLTPGIKMADPEYFEDFWNVPGYLGADPDGSARRDRIHMEAEVCGVHLPTEENAAAAQLKEDMNSVDDAWRKMIQTSAGKPWIELNEVPENDYLDGCTVKVLSGAAEGEVLALQSMDGKRALIGTGYGLGSVDEVLKKIKPGDKVLVDNSDYIAVQTLHRHLIPDAQFTTWDQYRDKNGQPVYPQRKQNAANAFKGGGAAAEQNGRINGKVIVVAALEDESALPWQPDWYRGSVARANPGREDEIFRLWYHQHANHGDISHPAAPLLLVPYLGALYQALVSVAAWVEKGIQPNATSGYTVDDGQVIPSPNAESRFGVQPVAELRVNGEKCTRIRAGEAVSAEAIVSLPQNGGKVTGISFSFEGEDNYPVKGEIKHLSNGATANAVHIYKKPGTYFVAVRVTSSLAGDDPFLQIANLDRARIIVE
jgi:hypothetical protein